MPYRKKPEPKENSWAWWVVIIAALWLLSQCNQTPESSPPIPKPTIELHYYDPNENARATARVEMTQQAWDGFDPYDTTAPDSDSTCNIKGNISFDTGEKIYHLPGQEYYDATDIDEAYGERWFCTEAEALAAGWRKSYK